MGSSLFNQTINAKKSITQNSRKKKHPQQILMCCITNKRECSIETDAMWEMQYLLECSIKIVKDAKLLAGVLQVGKRELDWF